MTKLLAIGAVVGATLVLSSAWPLHATAAARAPAVTVTPSSVTPTKRYYPTDGAYAGMGAIVTVKVGANKVLTPAFPVEVQECNPNPVSLDDCDMSTTLPFDQLSKRRVLAAANGSVTFHFLLWAPLPDKWDPASTLTVGPGHPLALWIGDDPSHWATTGIISPLVHVKDAASHVKSAVARAESAAAVAGAHATSRSSGGPDGAELAIIAVGALAALGIVAGSTVAISRRRVTSS
jgi:hypothetical protein